MVAAAGAGPRPIPFMALNSQVLRDAIQFCLTKEAAAAAQEIASKMRPESGVETAVASFHRNLPLENLSCEILPHHPAVWLYTKSKKTIRLSKMAAEVLIQHLKVDQKNLKT
jgi:hypothetical protein